jgi:hypothetical protein
MRLSADQVKQAIPHDDRDVREAASSVDVPVSVSFVAN